MLTFVQQMSNFEAYRQIPFLTKQCRSKFLRSVLWTPQSLSKTFLGVVVASASTSKRNCRHLTKTGLFIAFFQRRLVYLFGLSRTKGCQSIGKDPFDLSNSFAKRFGIHRRLKCYFLMIQTSAVRALRIKPLPKTSFWVSSFVRQLPTFQTLPVSRVRFQKRSLQTMNF